MGCGRGMQIGARAEAGIQLGLVRDMAERYLVGGHALGLHERLAVPFDAEPAKVVEDAFDVGGILAAFVEVLEAHDEFPVFRTRERPGEQRRKRVSQVHEPAGTWGDAPDDASITTHETPLFDVGRAHVVG